ncbi:DUF5343 domain-containing protein [Arthrobacter sp. lap29]|uniref:DUF5343 domain-containing protein n=1 Tax=Arthrobacter sp. lap29 TaxID=3056122 RepID=UPI0028F6FC80|nr:DUF5343 domain-containing protein [Arthrobacter sp. lap29]
MSLEVVEQKSYAYMSVTVWNSLRRAFFKSFPSKVTLTYLASALGIAEKTAKNILPQLRNLGLIDSEGVPTEIALEFRFEETYPKACKTLLELNYPLEVRELFDTKDADPAAVATWFMRHSKSGQSSASVVSKFYLNLLAENPLPEATKPTSKRAAKPAVPLATVQPQISAKIQATDAPPALPLDHGQPPQSPPHPQQGVPSLHIDMQVHIDPAASADQIDSIFASMAKHLYGR